MVHVSVLIYSVPVLYSVVFIRSLDYEGFLFWLQDKLPGRRVSPAGLDDVEFHQLPPQKDEGKRGCFQEAQVPQENQI